MAITASTGITSGIDYASLIDGLMKIERQPITLLENRQSALSSTKSALSTLSSKLKELQSAANELKSQSAFNVFTTSVSDTTAFTASASSSASAGNYTIKVNALAKNHQIVTSGVANKDTTTIAAGAGTFKFTVGSGAEQTVNVDATTTMQKLADNINALGAGATASVINTGTEYKLVLKSGNTGTSNSLTITQNNTTLTTSDLQLAANANITVDGLTVIRSSNTISDVIGGVTLNLLKADGADKTLTVSRDTDKIKEKITNLVNKYNAVVDYIKANNKYDTKTKVKGPLYGEAVTKTVMEKLRGTFQSTISGLSNTNMNELREAGVSIDKNGALSVDSTKLSDALSNNFNDVVNMFIDGTSTDGFGVTIYDAIDIFTNAEGSITKRISGYESTISGLDRQIEQKENNLARYQEKLRLQFAALESMITSLKAQQDYLAGALGG